MFTDTQRKRCVGQSFSGFTFVCDVDIVLLPFCDFEHVSLSCRPDDPRLINTVIRNGKKGET